MGQPVGGGQFEQISLLRYALSAPQDGREDRRGDTLKWRQGLAGSSLLLGGAILYGC